MVLELILNALLLAADIPLYDQRTLLNLAAEGDESAFSSLCKTYVPLLEQNIKRMVRDQYGTSEVLQETLIKLWINREKLREVEHVRAYFSKVAFNESLNYLSRLARLDKLRSIPIEDSQSPVDPESSLIYKETHGLIQTAINLLPVQRRKIYVLSRNSGLNSFEIAQQLRLSPDYVRQAISAARKHIREYLIRSGKQLLSICWFF